MKLIYSERAIPYGTSVIVIARMEIENDFMDERNEHICLWCSDMLNAIIIEHVKMGLQGSNSSLCSYKLEAWLR